LAKKVSSFKILLNSFISNSHYWIRNPWMNLFLWKIARGLIEQSVCHLNVQKVWIIILRKREGERERKRGRNRRSKSDSEREREKREERREREKMNEREVKREKEEERERMRERKRKRERERNCKSMKEKILKGNCCNTCLNSYCLLCVSFYIRQ
jgi:hypothetical protein